MNNDMFGKCGMTQFVGVGVCDTIGLYTPILMTI